MTQTVNRSGRKFNRVVLWVFLSVIVLLGCTIIFVVIRDNHQHNEVEASVDSLRHNLSEEGIVTQKNDGCGESYTEFGPNMKSCSVTITSQKRTANQSAADRFLAAYATAVARTGQFTANQPLPDSVTNKDSLSFGFASYTHKATGRICGVDYRFEGGKQQTTVGFSCDDTSWFVKTFE